LRKMEGVTKGTKVGGVLRDIFRRKTGAVRRIDTGHSEKKTTRGVVLYPMAKKQPKGKGLPYSLIAVSNNP